MKKFLVIVLGLTMVLGLATIAGAASAQTPDLKIDGAFEARITYDGKDGYKGLGYDDDYGYLLLGAKGPVGDKANGEITLGFHYFNYMKSRETSNERAFYISMASFNYDLTKNLSIGYQWAESNDGSAYKLYDGEDYCFDDTIGNINFDGQDYWQKKEFGVVKANLKFKGGSITAYSDLYPDEVPGYWGTGKYKMGKFTFNGWLAYDFLNKDAKQEVLTIIGGVDYKLNDQWTLSGFVGDQDSKVALGARTSYEIKNLVQVRTRLEYAVDKADWKNLKNEDSLYDYEVKATLRNMGNFRPYVEYDDDNQLILGFDNYIGNGCKIYAKYTTKDEDTQKYKLDLGLYYRFRN